MATEYTVQRRLGRNGWEDITAHMSKKAAEKALKTIRDTRKRIGLDDGKAEFQIWPSLPEQKEKDYYDDIMCPGPDCGRCNGSFCEEHGIGPCDCDVLARHVKRSFSPTPECKSGASRDV